LTISFVFLLGIAIRLALWHRDYECRFFIKMFATDVLNDL
jgi:hypothetical protein